MADLPLLINSVQHAPLRNFTLNTGYVDEVEGTPKLGLASLDSLAYLYELIRPSLSTLVELKIKSSLELPCLDVDIQFLRPAGDTLRSFECTFPSGNESVLDIIPDIFPNLTKLAITWSNFSSHSLPWKKQEPRRPHAFFRLRNGL
ncbi:hypothetical protein CPB84DRAFT_1768636 [Gymnopilus junonius]|uniref:Uncharacterized protein n=1 Tax=Gymnopilus junonius TaxID=109634 RepID=A0A9P5TSH3_GYMJU|nr:hypothetical protein CPB84DRAFT_1768636 [Gymnopilus junonius]